MKWFLNMKISAKLISAFIVVALIAGVIGTIGYVNMNTLGSQSIPSVNGINVIKEELAHATSMSNMLLSPKLTLEQKQDIYTEIEEIFTDLEHSISEYDSMDKTAEELAAWATSKDKIDTWKSSQDKFINLSKEITDKGIDDPSEVRYQIGLKQRDHLNWIYGLSQDVRADRKFTGQLDGTKCALGTWLEAYESRNPQFNQLMEDIEANHLQVHSSGEEINALVGTDSETRLEDIYDIFDNKTNVAMDSVLATLVEMDGIAKISDDLFLEMIDVATNEVEVDYDAAELTLDEMVTLVVKNANDSVASAGLLILSLTVIGVILSLGFGVIMSRLITRPIKRIVSVANEIADGNLDVEVRVDSKDEVGELSKAFLVMSTNINSVLTNINAASDQVAAGSRQVSDSSMSLSQGATEQASSIEELTASMEQIAAQTRANAENAEKARDMATDAQNYAEQGNSQMDDMLNAMSEINESSTNISKIIKVIDDIAFQTNILALNAAVEAARAGQHGKGFAVVAEEVRNLAARSANAAKETTTMIEGSIEKVEGGTKIANETAEALNKIVDGVSKATELVGEIAIASNEQALGVDQVNQGINQISDVVQTTSATAEETAAASEELSSQSDLLKSQVSTFRLKGMAPAKLESRGQSTATESVSPDVMKMLENMKLEPEMEGPRRSISLSDTEFEKY